MTDTRDEEDGLPSPDEIRRVVDYDAQTGLLTWKHDPNKRAQWNGQYAGKPALNTETKQGYLRGAINGRQFAAHRVAWVHFHGSWPAYFIDHIDGNRSNNAISNLRDVTPGVNARNCDWTGRNTTGATGVFRCSEKNRWRAEIRYDGVKYRLGYFKTFDEAKAARKAAQKLLGDYTRRHGVFLPTNVEPSEAFHVIRNGYFFRPKAMGYTASLADAGFFTADEAAKHCEAEGTTMVSASKCGDADPSWLGARRALASEGERDG